jgi:hypothetical protein
MRITGYILAVYILLLSAVPCCSFDNCPEDKTEQTTNHEQGDNPALPAGRDCGNCSPFFTCEGCGGFVSTIEILNFESAPETPVRTYSVYIESRMPDIHYDFWQPPKIA